MTWEDAYKVIEERLRDQWGATTPILWDNVKGKPPTDGSWVRATILTGQGQKTDLVNRYRHAGLLDVQLFSPAQKGTRALVALADQMEAIWRSVTVGGVFFRTPSRQRVGDTSDGWFQMNVSVPFFWDGSF